ncbi:hypothetical protein [Azotosporobacter soli]|uniref:hypothetical protein n=1 Tax=Azotosporobacter soli TaxID=3055040 RepID=UPI0031FEE1AD
MTNGIGDLGSFKVAATLGTSKSSENAKSNDTKPKYLTVRDGQYAYTYVVISDNFKVLIGRVPLSDEEKKEAAEKEEKAKYAASEAAKQQKEQEAVQSANAPFQNSQDYIACQQVVAQAKEKGMLPFL